MALKLVTVLATLAVASAGLIDAPGHLAYTGSDTYHYNHHPSEHEHYVAPVVHKTVEYAPVAKTVAYAPVAKTIEYPAPVKSTYYAQAPAVHHHSSAPSHTLAYPVSKTVAYAPAIYEHHETPTYGHTHESVERSHEGTVSHYGKTISTPHSHVQKYDTRVSNEHYKVAAVPVVQAAIPVVHKYEAPAVHHYSHAAPVQHHYSHEAPAVHHYSHEAPAVHHYSHAAPTTYVASAPAHQYSHAAPVHQYSHAAPAVQYAHSAPVVAHKTVQYSPSDAVAHTTFQSNDAHYSW